MDGKKNPTMKKETTVTKLCVLQDAITNMETATALVNANVEMAGLENLATNA
jgi:hypothetical protein